MIRSAIGFGLCLLAWAAPWPARLRADHFTINLKVETSAGSRTVHAQAATLGGAKSPSRPLLEGASGKPIAIHWTLTSTERSETFKDVLVHFFIVKEEKAGQQVVPKLDKQVEVESALTMDFKPGDKSQGEQTFQIDKPGVYLVRLETVGAAVGGDGHEHFAALDLVIK
jgi:hypothetical protein